MKDADKRKLAATAEEARKRFHAQPSNETCKAMVVTAITAASAGAVTMAYAADRMKEMARWTGVK